MTDKTDQHCKIGKVTWKRASTEPEPEPVPTEAPVAKKPASWWDTHSHYDRDGYCDNQARGY